MATEIKILNYGDVKTFELPPVFDAAARKKFFYQSEWVQNITAEFEDSYKVVFILLYGYFYAVRKFFQPKDFYEEDLDYVAKKMNVSLQNFHFERVTRDTVKRYKKIILEHFGYKAFNQESKKNIQTLASKLVSKQLKPKSVFNLLLKYLSDNRIEYPKYYSISKIITDSYNKFEKELLKNLKLHLSSEHKLFLDSLLDKVEASKESEHKKKIDPTLKRYKWTLIKRISQSTRASKIKENIKDLQIFQEIFEPLREVAKKMALSSTTIHYYANWARRAKIFHITSKSEEKRYLYFLCFILHQYYILQDVLIDTFLTSVQTAKNSSQSRHKDSLFDNRNFLKKKISDVTQFVKDEFAKVTVNFNTIEATLKNEQLSFSERVNKSLELINFRKKQKKQVKTQLEELESESHRTIKQDEYDILELRSLKLQQKVSKIVKHLDFNADTQHKFLLEAITYYRGKDSGIDKKAPAEFLNSEDRKAIFRVLGKIMRKCAIRHKLL